MELVGIVGLLALIEYWIFLMMTGQARGRYGVAAPATAGHPIFERFFRVQMNTIEQLVIFLPSLVAFAWAVSAKWAAALGVLFIVGRALYARGYIQDPAKRGPGFLLTLLANAALVLGALIGMLLHLRS